MARLTGTVRFGTPQGRWILAGTALASGMAFLDGTVVNVALPSIGADLDTGIRGLQWTLDSYLVTLSALMLLGGSLGDLYGRRRVLAAGLVAFTAASVVCAVAPEVGTLVAARAVQGVGAAMLVPGSLAIISATFHPDDRGRAIGAWSGLSGIATAIGPFVGGWLVDAASWRYIFLLNVPVAALALWIAIRRMPETGGDGSGRRPDLPGAVTASTGLALLAYGLIERTAWVAGAGAAALAAFVAVEHRRADPMLPLGLFRSRQFSGANVTTLAVYAALGGALFLVVLQLQTNLGYSALEAGASLLPVTLLMLLLSSRAGALAQRIGPRLPMTVGPLLVAAAMLLFARVEPGATYAGAVLPAAALFGLGLALTVAPLTAAVLDAVLAEHAGVGSAVNNAAARVAGLAAVAVLPAAAGIGGGAPDSLADGFPTAMAIAAVVAACGGVVALVTVRTCAPGRVLSGTLLHPCQDDVAQPAA